MAIEDHIEITDHLFVGTKKRLEFELFQEGADPTDLNAAMQDGAAWTYRWALSRAVRGAAAHRAVGPELVVKVTGAGIAVEGAYHADRALNTQRVVVTLAAADLAGVPGGTYTHALARTDVGFEDVLSFGAAAVLVAATS